MEDVFNGAEGKIKATPEEIELAKETYALMDQEERAKVDKLAASKKKAGASPMKAYGEAIDEVSGSGSEPAGGGDLTPTDTGNATNAGKVDLGTGNATGTTPEVKISGGGGPIASPEGLEGPPAPETDFAPTKESTLLAEQIKPLIESKDAKKASTRGDEAWLTQSPSGKQLKRLISGVDRKTFMGALTALKMSWQEKSKYVALYDEAVNEASPQNAEPSEFIRALGGKLKD